MIPLCKVPIEVQLRDCQGLGLKRKKCGVNAFFRKVKKRPGDRWW
jgi:hypothetical protein